jgi:hypothetical protein
VTDSDGNQPRERKRTPGNNYFLAMIRQDTGHSLETIKRILLAYQKHMVRLFEAGEEFHIQWVGCFKFTETPHGTLRVKFVPRENVKHRVTKLDKRKVPRWGKWGKGSGKIIQQNHAWAIRFGLIPPDTPMPTPEQVGSIEEQKARLLARPHMKKWYDV